MAPVCFVERKGDHQKMNKIKNYRIDCPLALKNPDHRPRAACWRLRGVGLFSVGPLGVEVAGVVRLVDAEVGPLGAEVELDPLLSVLKSLASFSSLKLKAVLSVLASFSSLKRWSSVVELNCWA